MSSRTPRLATPIRTARSVFAGAALGVALLTPASVASHDPITPVDLALAVLPADRDPEPGLLAGRFEFGPLVPGVNHAFGAEYMDGTQRVTLRVFLEAIADLGRPAAWNSRDDDNPAARFPIDPEDRLDESVEGAMLEILREYRAAEQDHWADTAPELFELARMIGDEPTGSADETRRHRLAAQGRQQHSRLRNALRNALPTIERHVAGIDDPDEAEAERRRLVVLASELHARMDDIDGRRPDTDPYRARLWEMLTENQRALATDGIIRRYLAQRMERDGVSPAQIRQNLRDAAAPQASTMTGADAREMHGAVTDRAPTDRAEDETPVSVSMTGPGSMMGAMNRMSMDAMGVQTEPLSAEEILSGSIDDALMTEAERDRLASAHPGDLENRLRQLRRQAVRRLYGTNAENRRSTPEPPSVIEALKGVPWVVEPRETRASSPRTRD